ncbi:ribonuclease H-like domain-containing protein [Tanacetum coccineum]
MIRTINNLIRTLLFQAHLPPNYWTEALNMAVYLLNILPSRATIVYCDNVSAVYLSSNPVQHQRTKHIEIDIHFVRDLVATGQVRVLHVPSRFQYADIFTKGLPSALFDEFHDSLSVRYTTLDLGQKAEKAEIIDVVRLWGEVFTQIKNNFFPDLQGRCKQDGSSQRKKGVDYASDSITILGMGTH